MTKEEALQKVTDYCTEKAYTSETLTDGFKDKFAEHFAKRFPETDANDENAIAELKFALNSAFSGASLIVTEKTNAFTSKENEYKNQIAELNKKLGNRQTTTTPPSPEIPKELQDEINALKAVREEETKKAKFNEILAIAKKSVRSNLHKSFETFAKGCDIALDKANDEQAKSLVEKYQAIQMDTYGDIHPLTPQQVIKQDDDVISKVKKVEL